ncbi:hypothetical protein JKI97_32525 (plasmid) [Rhodococcus qingshengii]|nr:hypothetical protein [Rhodococcus qingshengii]ULD45155.1 hypothetical protein JKI97_32525 [Rhodococcus qingshengii]
MTLAPRPGPTPYIVGKDAGSAIGTLVERQTRMVRLLHLPFVTAILSMRR